jgi:hypothetical protein
VLVYLEASDVGRAAEMGAAGVRYHERLGRLRAAAKTLRGTKLYTREDVEEFRRLYGRRRRGDSSGGR